MSSAPQEAFALGLVSSVYMVSAYLVQTRPNLLEVRPLFSSLFWHLCMLFFRMNNGGFLAALC
jgi:hypothetical protein